MFPASSSGSPVFVIIGYIIVVASVIGGFVLSGGHVAALMQPLEVLMIGGAAIGAFFVGNTPKAVKATMKALRPCSRVPSTRARCTWS